MNARDRITEARASHRKAVRDAQAAWNAYTEQENARNVPSGKYEHGMRSANRAQAATHLPEDIRELLGIDRYGSKVR